MQTQVRAGPRGLTDEDCPVLEAEPEERRMLRPSRLAGRTRVTRIAAREHPTPNQTQGCCLCGRDMGTLWNPWTRCSSFHTSFSTAAMYCRLSIDWSTLSRRYSSSDAPNTWIGTFPERLRNVDTHSKEVSWMFIHKRGLYSATFLQRLQICVVDNQL